MPTKTRNHAAGKDKRASNEDVMGRINEYLRQLAPQAKTEQAAMLLAEAAKELQKARDSRDWYKQRVELLQRWQAHMRDPERTLVCDILANGATLPDAERTRYPY